MLLSIVWSGKFLRKDLSRDPNEVRACTCRVSASSVLQAPQ